MMLKLFFGLVLICFTLLSNAQDTLPNFTLRDLGKNRIQVSWKNPFETAVQINVQRSYDSLKAFQTIFAPQSPGLPQNGFVDTKARQGVKVYYRIFFVLAGGAYFFSPTKSPATGVLLPQADVNPDGSTLITIKLRETVIGQLTYDQYKLFRDSIVYKTRDTIYANSATEVVIRPFIAKEIWKPSQYIFTNRDGYVTIKLPAIQARHYRVVFFDDRGNKLFEIVRVKESELVLDKVNFVHAGWFHFELYEDERLKERNKFYLSRDF
jgi:hypothetical protein